jgi:hypothetical protein
MVLGHEVVQTAIRSLLADANIQNNASCRHTVLFQEMVPFADAVKARLGGGVDGQYLSHYVTELAKEMETPIKTHTTDIVPVLASYLCIKHLELFLSNHEATKLAQAIALSSTDEQAVLRSLPEARYRTSVWRWKRAPSGKVQRPRVSRSQWLDIVREEVGLLPKAKQRTQEFILR